MGVPKFYRWISERYPCLSEVVKEFQIPEFDNLYLDMNGIIHVCSHPDDNNPHFRITEEKIFADIFHYIEFLFRMIKPRKVFFMAVDGVAPRAKMNQQRGRRFRSAREAENLIKEAESKGEKLPTEKRFDSNCITPGTEFMVRLQEQLKYFVTQKMSSDPLWQGPQVYLSGHETPGEGEHKIMEYIRFAKSQPGYDDNTRHCLYGLDADLIMLGLVSHEPHFSLLREEVRFGGKRDKNKRPATPEETTFHLLHLSLLREYIDYEFSPVRDKLKFAYDLENIIDDWILMGFLVGNDFIPHLPHLHIHHDALPMLWRTYMEVLPSLDGYLNTGGHLHLDRFEKYVNVLGRFDKDTFENETYVDLKFWESKTGKKQTHSSLTNADRRRNKRKPAKEQLPGNQFSALVDNTNDNLDDDDEDVYQTPDEDFMETDDDDDLMTVEFKKHKDDYYMNKLAYESVTQAVMEEQAQGYVLAIQWILLYYFEGVPSWSWFYPHHYAPYISDVKNFRHMKIRFELGTPFLPFQQLMAVLPAASKELLPTAYQELMTDQNSPIIDFYPVDFQSDLNGKQQDWEAVVLIPFIEEKRLLAAMATKERQLTPSEQARNAHGPCIMYQHSMELQPTFPSRLPGVFKDITVNHAKSTEIPPKGFLIPSSQMVKGVLPGVRLDVHYPGFPTFKHIRHTTYLKKAGVKVFQANSRNESMMLRITEESSQTLDAVASRLLGDTTFVDWPHLQEARVVAVSDGVKRIELDETAASKKSSRAPGSVQRVVKSLDSSALLQFQGECCTIKQRYHDRLAVELGNMDIIIYCCIMTGRRYVCGSHSQLTLEKQFSSFRTAFALQATVKDIASSDPSFSQFKTLEELFPGGSTVFMLGLPHYGCQGQVMEVDQERGRVRVAFSVTEEPDMEALQDQVGAHSMRYMPGHVLAQRLGVTTHFISRITGTIFVLRRTASGGQAKVNIGLNLKFTKRKLELPGYTKRMDEGWSYSEKALETVGLYLRRFPGVAEGLTKLGTGGDMYAAEEIFPETGPETLEELQHFLQELPCASMTPMEIGSNILDEGDVKHIEQEIDRIKQEGKQKKQAVKILVKPSLLFRPVLYLGPVIPDPDAKFVLYDRVVVTKPAFSVPLGLRGTVIGIHPAEKEIDIIYDVVFDEEFIGGITLRCSPSRGYRVPGPALINLSHGQRREEGKNPHQATPRPDFKWGQSSRPRPPQHSPQRQAASGSQQQNSYSNLMRNLQQPCIFMPQDSMPARSTSARSDSSSQKSQRMSATDGSADADFANIWKELRGSPVAQQGSMPKGGNSSQGSMPKGGNSAQASSVMEAAMEALKKITPPHKSAEPQQSARMEVRSLFGHAAQPFDATTEEEFCANFQRLEATSKSDADAEENTNANASASLVQDHSLQLKQMLKIGEESGSNGVAGVPTSPQPSRSYGRQVSLQELFSVAKQTLPGEHRTAASISSEQTPSSQSAMAPQAPPPPKSSPPHSAGRTPQQQQQPSHPGHSQPPTTSPHPPGPCLQPPSTSPRPPGPGFQPHSSMPRGPSLSSRPPGPQPRAPMPPQMTHRNPVVELSNLAQRQKLGSVVYDYYKTKGLFTASAIMSSGSRFDGTPCHTKEEAAESAASMALLLLNGAAAAHNPFMGMALSMAPQNQIYSQGSAFSPVRPRGIPPHLLPQPRGFGPRQPPFPPRFPPFLGGPGPGPRGVGMHPPPRMGPHGNFPPPRFPPGQPPPHGMGPRHPAQFGPSAPFGGPPPQGPQASGAWEGQGQGSQAHKKGTDPNFIPLQESVDIQAEVQRKQKSTPRKSETVEGNGAEPQAATNVAEGLLIDFSEPDPKPSQEQPSSQLGGAASDPSSGPSSHSATSTTPQLDAPAKKGGKRRPRMAANFGGCN